MQFNIRGLVPALILAAVMAVPSFASTIVLGINGDAKVGLDYIDFGTYPVGAPYNHYPGSGTFQVSSPVADVFAANGVTSGETGKIASLDAAVEPVGTNLIPKQFMTFDAGGSNLQLFLTELFPGAGPSTPFNLSDTPGGATASFAVAGFIYNSTTKMQTAYTGLFDATFSGMTVAQLIADVPVETPFSATFSITPVAPVPEPASLLLMGIGLLGAGIVARKRFTRVS